MHRHLAWIVVVLFALGGSSVHALTISEIQYSPKPGGPNLEFIELHNQASEPVDVSHFFFVRGITYTIPYPTFIRGKGYLVVAADPDALKAAHPILAVPSEKFPRVVGPFTGRLDDSGETIALANPGGAVVVEVEYNNRGSWPAEAEKSGHSLILSNPEADVGRSQNWRPSPTLGGTPGLANLGETVYDETVLVGDAEPWRFLRGVKAVETDPDPPSTPIEAWRAPDFDDSRWEEGPAGFGFETVPVPEFRTPITGMEGAYLSLYFRKSFQVDSTEGIDDLILRLGYDDGFVAYLNGVEVVRKNMRAGLETYADRAFGSGETKVGDAREKFNLSSFAKDGTLKVGRNVLAVQVHNSTITGNDLGFVPQLYYRTASFVGGGPLEIPVRINELNSSDPSDRWLELYNESPSPVDLSGFFITNDAADPAMFEVPAGTVIPAEGFLVLTEAQLAAGGVALQLPAGMKSLWIGLSRPDFTGIVDAYAFQPPAASGLSEARFPDGGGSWVVARTPTKGSANRFDVVTNVVINEIMYNPYHPFRDFTEPGSRFRRAEDQGEYIEIFNRGPSPVSLAGWSLSEAVDFDFPDIFIEPGEHLVIAKDPDWLAEHYMLDRAKVLGPYYNLRTTPTDEVVIDLTGGFLANDGEEIELHDELGNEVDEVPYSDSGDWPVWTDGRGPSLELIDPFQDNSEGMAWDASDESGKAEWKHFVYSGARGAQPELKFMLLTQGSVIIDNLSIRDPANAAVPNFVTFGSFDQPLAAADVLFGGNHAWSGITSTDVKDGAGALRIVSTGRGNNRADRVEVNTFMPALPSGSQLQVEFDARWVCGEGVLLTAGFDHSMARSHFVPVPTRLGTPGRENSVRLRLPNKNLGPVISDVRHSPALPAPGVEVQVRARISDSDGVPTAALEWRLDETPETGIQTVALADDGEHGDGGAGDGLYTGVIPGQALNKIVVFRITARDGAGNTSRYPMDESSRSYPLRTDPANLAPAGSRTNPPRKHLSYQHIQYTPDPVRSYRLIFSRENWAYLQGRPIMSNDLVNATFIYNDAEAYYNVGVRFGNSPWTRPGYSPANQSYRVKFGKDRPFQGYRKFKIDNQRNENLMDERVAWYLFKANASYSPTSSPCYLEHFYCQPYVSFNSTQTKLAHIYDHMEVPAAPFLDKWFPEDSDGVLYKVDDRFEVDDAGNRSTNIDGRLIAPPVGSVPTDKENYRWFFMHRARDKFDDFSELIEAAQILDNRRTPNATEFNQKLFDKFNVEQMARTWALSINIDDWDTWGTTRGKNCYVYKTRADGRWNLIPWDKDLIFGNPSGLPAVPGNHSEVARILNSPNGRRIYQNILNDMLQDFWNPAYVNNFFSELTQVAPGLGSYARGASFLSTRANTIRSFLGAQPPAFQITSPTADVVTLAEPTIVISGSAPLGIWSVLLKVGSNTPVLLDPMDGGLNWSGTRWTTRAIELSPGTNEITLLGFGAGGDLRGEDGITAIVSGEPFFTRGDTDRNGSINLTDAIVILNHLFQGVAVPDCHDALDTDDTGVVDMTDAIYLLDHLFRGGPPLPAPYPDPGVDGTADTLTACSG